MATRKKNTKTKPEETEKVGTLEMTETAPRVLLEILVRGVEDDKKKIKPMLDAIQNQISDNRKAKNRVRILWYMDGGEMTDEEKVEWLLSKTRSKYHLFAPTKPYTVSGTYVRDALLRIRKLEDSLVAIKEYGLRITGKNYDYEKEKEKNTIPEAEVIDESPLKVEK
jgi:hypothetical protein